jgi:hypothetical protein
MQKKTLVGSATVMAVFVLQAYLRAPLIVKATMGINIPIVIPVAAVDLAVLMRQAVVAKTTPVWIAGVVPYQEIHHSQSNQQTLGNHMSVFPKRLVLVAHVVDQYLRLVVNLQGVSVVLLVVKLI